MSNFKKSLESDVLKGKFLNLLESLDRTNTSKMIIERHYANLCSLEIAEGKVTINDAAADLKGLGVAQNKVRHLLTATNITESNNGVADKFMLQRVAVLETAIKELGVYSWMKPVSTFINETTEFLKKNHLNILLERVIYSLESDKNSGYYKAAITKLSEARESDNLVFAISENLTNEKWITPVKSLLEYCEKLKGSTNGHNPNFKVSRIYSPIEFVNETYIFNAGGKTFETDGKTITEFSGSLSENFKSLVTITESAKFEKGVMRLYPNPNSIVDINFNGESPKISVNNKLVEAQNLESFLLASGFLRFTEKDKANRILQAVSEGHNIKEIDFGYNVTASVFEGVSVNVFNLGENIYVQKINKGMKENSFVLAESAEDAVRIVKDFMNYDISGSLVHLLENEKAESELRNKEISKIEGRIKFLMESRENLIRLAKVNGIENSEKIKSATQLLDTQISEQTKALSKLDTSKTVNESCVPGKEYKIGGEAGWVYQGVADGIHIFNNEAGGKQPKNYSDEEFAAAHKSGEIVECGY